MVLKYSAKPAAMPARRIALSASSGYSTASTWTETLFTPRAAKAGR